MKAAKLSGSTKRLIAQISAGNGPKKSKRKRLLEQRKKEGEVKSEQ